MAEYIEREALIARLKFKVETDPTYNHLKQRGLESAMARVRKAPAADVVEVVRCKDCEHCVDAHNDGFMYCMRPIEAEDYSETGYRYPLEVRVGFNGFCSYGERRDSDATD